MEIFALKGLRITAQGNALGNGVLPKKQPPCKGKDI
jgi:hypothetical protein